MIRGIVALLLALSIAFVGCASPRIILHPIEKEDIMPLDKGQQFTAPKQGWFLSDEWFKEVGDAKVEKEK